MSIDWPPMKERGPQITEAAVVIFETQLGTKLPDDYRAFLLEVNGGQTARSHRAFTIFMRKVKDETLLNSLNSLDDPDDQFNLATRWISSRHQLPPDPPDLPPEVIPIGYDEFGGTVGLVIAGPRRGQVWFLDGYDPRPEGSGKDLYGVNFSEPPGEDPHGARVELRAVAVNVDGLVAGTRPLPG